MDQRKLHRLLGLIMVLPLLGWAATGVIFLTKPGYNGAYEPLAIKTYPLDSAVAIAASTDWKEIKLLRSALGLHLLVKQDGAVKQYDPATLLPAAQPSEPQLRTLITDAISVNPERYGVLERIEGFKAYTSTGVTISLNWDGMQLSQHGRDRSIIEALYRIHYLQWTKWESINRILAVAGLLCLTILTIIGLMTFLSRERQKA